MLEIFKKCGIEEAKANEVLNAMKEAGIHTTSLENADVRYNKLQEQKKQLEEASKNYEKQLKELSKNNADNEELKKQLEQLQLSNKELETKHAEEMNKLQFDFALDKGLSSAKVKDTKLIKALLDMDNIKYQEGNLEGLDSQIEAIKTSHSYLFDLEPQVPNSTGGLGNFGRMGKQGITKEQFNSMSYSQRMELYTNDRSTYDALVSEN